VPHRPGGEPEKMVLIDRRMSLVQHQPQISFVDERGRLQGVVGSLVSQERAREPMQLSIYFTEQTFREN
jgi:hypothetical protein